MMKTNAKKVKNRRLSSAIREDNYAWKKEISVIYT